MPFLVDRTGNAKAKRLIFDREIAQAGRRYVYNVKDIIPCKAASGFLTKFSVMDSAQKDEKDAKVKRYAYVTLLLGTSDWWKGVVALAKSLKMVGARHPLVVAVGEEVPEEQREVLRSHDCEIMEIIPILPPKGAKDEDFSVSHYKLLYTKLRIWEMDGHDRVIYLDADTLVLQNLDHLFWTVPDGAVGAALDCFCERESHPVSRRRNGYCQIDPLKNPWEGPDSLPPLYFNVGVLVLSPSRKVFEDIMEKLAFTPPSPLAEQDFLNEVIHEKFFKLPNDYNLLIPLLWNHPQKVQQLGGVKVVHFSVVGAKPWKYDRTKENLSLPVVHCFVEIWKKVYDMRLG